MDKRQATWRLTVAYHGAAFLGWQKQDGARTVQSVLEEGLSRLSGGPVKVRAAGRTDAGVHARGQVVSTTFTSRVPEGKMILALASVLPDDVSVTRAECMPPGFDAKKHSVGKKYVYRVHTQAWRDPLLGSLAWHVRARLDVPAMKRAAAFFLGENDFESFRSVHCDAAHARRYLWKAELQEDGPLLVFEVRGNAFCRHMVRTLAGTLVDVGKGRFEPDDIPRILAARDRTQSGMTAPAQGLMLEEVYYPDTIAGAGVPPEARFPGFPVDVESWTASLQSGNDVPDPITR